MDIGLIQTKVRVPRVGRDVWSRPRLLTWLEDYLPELKLGLIVSPAGSGKSTLLADFARESDLPVCWLALDELDNDLHRFCAYFVAALQAKFDTCGRNASAFLQNTPHLEQQLDSFVTVLVNDILTHIPEHFVLVLDDFQLVNDNEAINYFLDLYLARASDNSHVALLTRELPHLSSMVSLLQEEAVDGIDFDLLAFTAEEVRDYWSQTSFTPTEEQVESLMRRTQGWITGLKLSEIGGTAQNQVTSPPMLMNVAGDAADPRLDRYFARQVWQPQEPAVREVLLLTAVPDVFNEPLCTAVFGPAPGEGLSWGDLLTELRQRNLFVTQVGEHGEWLQYQDLFRDFLRRKLAQERPQDTAVWRRKLADYYATEGEWVQAFALYRQLGDFAALATAVEQAWPILAAQGQYGTLAQWLAKLPQQYLLAHPRLLARLGLARFNSQQHRDQSAPLDEAVRLLRVGDDTYALGEALAWRAIQKAHTGARAQALRDTAEAIALADKDTAVQNAFWLAEAYRVRGLVLWRRGAFDEALEALQQARQKFPHSDGKQERGLALTVGLLGKVYRVQGHYELAETCYREAYAVWERLGNQNEQSDIANSLGVLYHAWGDFLQAEHWLEQAWELARASRQLRQEVYALCGLGDLYADLGALAAAQAVYAQVFEGRTAVQDRYLRDYVNLRRAEMARWQGEWATGRAFLARCADTKAHDTRHWLTREQLLYRWHETQDTAVVAELLALPAETNDRVTQAVTWQWAAWVAWQATQTAEMHRALQEMLSVWVTLPSSVSVLATAVGLGDAWAEALQKLNAELAQVDHFVAEIAAFRVQAMQVRRDLRHKPLAVPLGPPQLTIYTLGRYDLALNGDLVQTKEWLNQTLVRKLLALLLVQPRGLSKEQIGVVLWPEASTKQVTGRLRNVGYKLRLAARQDVMSYDNATGLYRFNWDLDYVFDAERVRYYAEQARDHGREEDWRQVLRWHGGEFLPEFDEDIFLRERPLLMDMKREALRHAAVLAEQRGDEAQAEDDWRELLALEPLDPYPAERLMYLYKRLNQRHKILAIYQTHVEAAAVLDLPPDDRLTDLKERLLRSYR